MIFKIFNKGINHLASSATEKHYHIDYLINLGNSSLNHAN